MSTSEYRKVRVSAVGENAMMKIISNKARCRKCGEVIESYSVHDFVQCRCKAIFVDGGKEYLRRGGELEDIEELSEYIEEKPCCGD